MSKRTLSQGGSGLGCSASAARRIGRSDGSGSLAGIDDRCAGDVLGDLVEDAP